MVGLTSVWPLLISLLLFAACVPQKKQTECGSNEAFNSQLRSCVPIVQGPSAFINIDSYSPLYTATRYKNDTTPVTFTISVSNPYNQVYSIEWDMNYNGAINTIAGNVTTTSIIPAIYSGQIGSNVITAKIMSGGKVVDSHNFEVIIQETPRPNINTATIFPADYNPILYPDSTGQRFSFTERNNGAVSLTDYRVYWTLSKNGIDQPAMAEADTFTNTATNGTNVIYYGTSVTPKFNPASLGVGSYVLRARMENFVLGEVVSEQQWNVVVKDPDFGFVTTAGSPLPSQDTVAFHTIGYDAYPFANSVPTQSRFCVTVSDPDGSYADGSGSDPTSKSIVVRFYKDNSGSPLFEGKTDASIAKDTVCFDEASAAEKAALIFNDGSPVTPYYRSVTARVFDEQTGREMCQAGLSTCPVTYPINWKVLVKPIDTGVTGTFQAVAAGDNITYTSSGSPVRTANVVENQNVTVRFLPSDGIVGYEGYDMKQSGAANSGHFQYDIVVQQGGTTVSTIPCKATAAAFPFDGVTNNQFCTFAWPAYNTTTNAHLDPGAYVMYLRVTDNGSPVPGSIGTVSNALTINATVSEPVNPPVITAASDIMDASGIATIASANEGDTIRFRAFINEAEHDDYTLNVQFCGTDATCAPASLSPAGTDSRVYGDVLYPENTAITYAIPEDALGTTASATVYFLLTATDAPTDPSKASAGTRIISLTVNNANPDGSFDPSKVTPANGATYKVFAGYQFTGQLNAAISDASLSAAERPNKFQWWIGTINDATAPAGWVAIEGATQSTLRWTPGSEISGTRYIAVCWSDGYPRTDATSVNPPNTAGDPNQRCQSLWTITPQTNSSILTNIGGPNGEVAVFNVPSENIAYVAYASINTVNVEKVEYRADGTLGRPMAAVSFPALPGGATSDNIKNLSLVASDTALYIAYLADASGIPGTSFRAQVRKINISKAVGEGSKTAASFTGSVGMTRKFGFTYTAVPVGPVCAGAGNCVYDAVARTVTFNGAANNPATDSITVNGVTLNFKTQSTKAVTDICSDCNDLGQAASFAAAINASPNTGLQGITATASGTVVTLYGMEVNGTEQYSGTNVITSAGKILYNTDNSMWYWPVANADLIGAQNKIQVLRGANNTVASPTTTNSLTGLDDVSAIDNAWSTDSPLQMYISYIKLVGGTAKITKNTIAGNDVVAGAAISILPAGLGAEEIQMAGPLGTDNPNVYISLKDTTGSFWMSRFTNTLASHNSYEIQDYGADAANTTILDLNNVSRIAIVPARPAVAGGTTDEARLAVVSKNTGVVYNSYLFRWKTVAGAPVLETSTTIDRDGEETSSTSFVGVSAPTSTLLGNNGAIAGENTNASMGFVRARADGEVEFNLLNTEVESINSTTNSATGEFRAPYIK